MSALPVQNCGSVANAGSGSGIATTLAAAPSVGNTLVALVAFSSTTQTVTGATDTAGNTWSVDKQVNLTGSTVGLAILSAPVTAALIVGNQVTVAFSGAVTNRIVSIEEFSGVLTSTPVDQTASATGTSTSPATGATSATTQADELLIAAFAHRGTVAATLSTPAGFTPLTVTAIDTGTGSSSRRLVPFYDIVATTGAQSASATLSSSQGWAAAIVTYKAAAAVTLVPRSAGRKRRSRQPAAASGGLTGRSLALTRGISGTVGRSLALSRNISPGVGRSLSLTRLISGAAIRYLDPVNGSDSGDGLTPGTAWKTISKTLATAPTTACEVYVRAGATTGYTIPNSSPRARSDYLTFRPYPGEEATAIFGGFGAPSTGLFHLDWIAVDGMNVVSTGWRGAHWKVLNCTIPGGIAIQDGSNDFLIEDTNIGGNVGLDPTFPGTGIFLSSSTTEPAISNGIIRRCRLDGLKYVGINIRNFNNILVEDVTVGEISDPDATHTDAFRTFAGGTGLVLRRCVVESSNVDQGFFFKDGAVSNVLMENCVCGPLVGGNEANIYDVTNFRMINCTIDGNVVFQGNSTDVVLFNNAISSLTLATAVAGSPANTVNFIFQDYNLIGSYGGGLAAGANSVTATATFINAAANDYRLAAGSPGLNVGTTAGGGYFAPANDALSRARPVGVVDIGAYERQATDP